MDGTEKHPLLRRSGMKPLHGRLIRREGLLDQRVHASHDRCAGHRLMALDRCADMHDVDGVARQSIIETGDDGRPFWAARRELLGAPNIGVDDNDDAAAGAADRVRVPLPHQSGAHDGGANGPRGGSHRQTVASRSAPMCIPDKPRSSSLSSWTRRPVVAE